MKHINFSPAAFRRVTAFWLAVLITAVSVFTYVVPPAAAADTETVSLYHWRKIQTKHDLIPAGKTYLDLQGKQYYFMLMWKNGNTWYYSAGDSYTHFPLPFSSYDVFYGKPVSTYPDIDPDSDEFYTTGNCGAWTMTVSGYDSDLQAPKIRIGTPNGKIGTTTWGDLILADANNAPAEWTVCTSDCKGSYAKNTKAGKVQFPHVIDHATDDALAFMDNMIYGYSSTSYDYPDFTVFYGEVEEMNTILSLTVPSGTTYQVKNNTMIKGTVTVEPGAVFSITGNCFNCGMIENYGTVVVRSRGMIRYFGDKSLIGGKINCKGSDRTLVGSLNKKSMKGEGNLIVDRDGWVVNMRDVTLTRGASIVCEGCVSCPSTLTMTDASIRIGAVGTLILGKQMTGGFGAARLGGTQVLYEGTFKSDRFRATMLPVTWAYDHSVIFRSGVLDDVTVHGGEYTLVEK